MPAIGEYRNRFSRNYVWVIPTDLGPGTWRLTADDDPDTPGPSPETDYFQATVDSGTPTILKGQLVYINDAGNAALASSTSTSTTSSSDTMQQGRKTKRRKSSRPVSTATTKHSHSPSTARSTAHSHG